MFSPYYLQTEQGSNAWIWYLLLVLIVVLLIVWWINRRQAMSQGQPPDAAIQSQPGVTPDNLRRIEGIGPKVSSVLNEAGITTFEALSRANPTDVQKTLNDAGLQMMNPEGWIEQASLAGPGTIAKRAKGWKESLNKNPMVYPSGSDSPHR